MIKQAIIAALLLGAAPALAADGPATSARETRVPRIGRFLEHRADGNRGVYIRADTGRWYYARMQGGQCPRLRPNVAISFLGARGGNFDRFGAIRVEGWRCMVDSVVESPPPPGRRG
jgi:hypothetical protein